MTWGVPTASEKAMKNDVWGKGLSRDGAGHKEWEARFEHGAVGRRHVLCRAN